jgi:hypothetical protein
MNEEDLAAKENITISRSEKRGFHLSVRQIVDLPALYRKR